MHTLWSKSLLVDLDFSGSRLLSKTWLKLSGDPKRTNLSIRRSNRFVANLADLKMTLEQTSVWFI